MGLSIKSDDTGASKFEVKNLVAIMKLIAIASNSKLEPYTDEDEEEE